MAFLDNSGDIILDAVLTDTGRMRLARGDGSFKIAKFAFGDDEINYASFNASHSSGSAYYDLEVLQTPILEAFTNNTATMKSKLISLSNNNLLYLPVMVLNEKDNSTARTIQSNLGSGSFIVFVDDDTKKEYHTGDDGWGSKGVMNGITPSQAPYCTIQIDQGLNTAEVSADFSLDSSLKETQYIIEIDNRLGKIVAPDTDATEQSVSFVDDDNIATYFISQTGDSKMIADLPSGVIGAVGAPTAQVIKGPRGTSLSFRIKTSIELNSSTFLFEQIGSTIVGPYGAASADYNDYYYIDTIVRVTGATTGYRIDIPVRFFKFKE